MTTTTTSITLDPATFSAYNAGIARARCDFNRRVGPSEIHDRRVLQEERRRFRDARREHLRAEAAQRQREAVEARAAQRRAERQAMSAAAALNRLTADQLLALEWAPYTHGETLSYAQMRAGHATCERARAHGEQPTDSELVAERAFYRVNARRKLARRREERTTQPASPQPTAMEATA